LANTKISALTTGTPAVGTDEIPIARGGANNKLTLAQVATLINASPTLTGVSTFAGGSVAAPGLVSSLNSTSGFGSIVSGRFFYSSGGSGVVQWQTGAIGMNANVGFGWTSGDPTGTAQDLVMSRAGANSIQFAQTSSTVTTNVSRTEINKLVTAIADATLTATFTITVPNAAHSASILVRMTGSLGAGGAIGANEASASNSYVITIARTAGVNAVAAISSAFGAAAAAVAGAATVTCTAAMSAVSGAVGASNTFTVNVTITKSGGASANHTCLCYAQLMNANATGIGIA
jgi:hypothetical protein